MIARPLQGNIEGLLLKLDLFQKEVVERFKDVVKVFTRNKAGYVPAPGQGGITRFLREDGTWAVP